MQSIQSKLTTGLLLSLIIAFSALWLLVSINLQFLSKEYIASRLKHDTETLLNSIKIDDNDNLAIDESHIDAIYKQPFSGHYYVISTNTETLSSRSLWDKKLNHVNLKTGQQLRTLQKGPEQQSLLLMSIGYKKQGHQFTITLAEDLDPINKNIEQLQYWFAAIAFCMLLSLVMLQVFILRSSLKPLAKIHTELKSLQQGKLDKLSTDSANELRPLINEVNHLLTLMEQRLLRSRDALSDLAHAIKKPLTVIQQVIAKSDFPDETRTTLMKQTDDIYQLTDRILKRARLAGHRYTGALFSFSEDVPPLIKTLDMMYASKTLQLTTTFPDNISCRIDREDMLELLGNLLDNAYKWATQKIIFSVTIDTDLNICIEDDGPGVDPEKINELSKRGVRLDEKIQGHGFGLAIAADIASDYNGSITFKHSTDLGGFRADVKLPLHQL